ncbi:two-component sensor histidine kinase, partial [Streptomyces anthocyanicus]
MCAAAAREGGGRAVLADPDPYRARRRLPAGQSSVTKPQDKLRGWAAARRTVMAGLRFTSLRLRLVVVFGLVALTAAVSA